MKEEKAIKENWKNSPLNKDGKIELVPTDWVWQYRGQDVSPNTDLMDGSEADLDELWKDICEKGLYEPLIMRVGIKNKKFRLESGNHRIKLFHEHHVPQVPLIVQIQDELGLSKKEINKIIDELEEKFDVKICDVNREEIITKEDIISAILLQLIKT